MLRSVNVDADVRAIKGGVEDARAATVWEVL